MYDKTLEGKISSQISTLTDSFVRKDTKQNSQLQGEIIKLNTAIDILKGEKRRIYDRLRSLQIINLKQKKDLMWRIKYSKEETNDLKTKLRRRSLENYQQQQLLREGHVKLVNRITNKYKLQLNKHLQAEKDICWVETN